MLADPEKLAPDLRSDFNLSDDAKEEPHLDVGTDLLDDDEMLIPGKSVATQLKLV